MKFVLASHNRKKLAEMQEILRELGVEVVLQSDVGLDLEPEEKASTSCTRWDTTPSACPPKTPPSRPWP